LNKQSGPSPYPRVMKKFWGKIWSKKIEHNHDGYWLEEVRQKAPQAKMTDIVVSPEEIEKLLKRASNWAAPGPDKLHNHQRSPQDLGPRRSYIGS
ncbi:hypothetical protein HHI36_015759, partial [Cryptolaemus montrouzieri]